MFSAPKASPCALLCIDADAWNVWPSVLVSPPAHPARSDSRTDNTSSLMVNSYLRGEWSDVMALGTNLPKVLNGCQRPRSNKSRVNLGQGLLLLHSQGRACGLRLA